MSNVKISDLTVRFGSQTVIQSLNLEVFENEFLVLLGPSGCGKSTLLHSIAGLVEIAQGRIEIGGQDMTWADPTDRNIGMVFQSYALYPTMTVEGNISFGLRVKGVAKAEIETRVKRVAEMLQLESLLKRKPSQLSGGQRQRVAIGRALVREVGVFLLDEPLSNLDAQLRAELRRELKVLHHKLRATMIYVTHDQVEAMTLATRIVVMRNGTIQQIGSPAMVYHKPDNLFVAGFLGAPGMNFITGTLICSGDMARFENNDFGLDVPNYSFKHAPVNRRSVVMGIRPEGIRIEPTGEFAGVVTLVEPMGNHQVVWADFGASNLSVVASEAIGFAVGEKVRFSIDDRLVSLFCQTNEQRI